MAFPPTINIFVFTKFVFFAKHRFLNRITRYNSFVSALLSAMVGYRDALCQRINVQQLFFSLSGKINLNLDFTILKFNKLEHTNLSYYLLKQQLVF